MSNSSSSAADSDSEFSKFSLSIPSELLRLRTFFSTGIPQSEKFRRTQLESLMQLLNANVTEISEALYLDLGKSRYEAILYEIETCKNEIDLALKNLSSWMRPENVSTPLALLPGKSEILYEPLGLVLIIAPFNYPLQLLLIPFIHAIAAGNVAVLKCSELTPAINQLMGRLLPNYLNISSYSYINYSHCGPKETSFLLTHRFDFIFFTGSESVGKLVLRAAADSLTPVALELGGKSPCIVTNECDLELSVRKICNGKFINCSQTCIAPDYILVHRAIAKEFIELMKKQIIQFYGLDALKSPDYSRIINEKHFQRLISIIKADENSVLYGGKSLAREKYIEPTLIRANENSKCMKEELFGPIMPIIEYESIESAIEFVTRRPKPLALYVFTNSDSVANQIINRTSSGGVAVNDCLVQFANPSLPFGGVGTSGMGRYHGRHGFRLFSNEKSILRKGLSGDVDVRYPPYSDRKLAIAKFAASINQIDSETVGNVWKKVVIPSTMAVVAHKLGFRISKL